MKRLLTLSLLFASILSTAAAEPTPERMAAAKKLSETMNLRKQMQAGFNAMLPVVDQQALGLGLDATSKQELVDVFRAWYLEDLDQEQMLQNVIVLYAETFTEQELTEMNAFYRTPVGQRVLTALPEIMQKAAMLGMKEAESKQQMLMDRLKKFRESKGK